MQQAAITAVGSGSMKKEERRRVVESWRRAARPGRRQRPELSREQQAYMLGQMGIKVEWQKN
jgi:hypothetical protein